MSKQIKIADTDELVTLSTIEVVEIGSLSFEYDERYPWIDVYALGDEKKEFLLEIDDDMPVIVDSKDLEVFALNWYFKNVGQLQELERTAQEVPVQEQLGSRVIMHEMKSNLLQGKNTVNQIRSVFGLRAIKDANKYITKV